MQSGADLSTLPASGMDELGITSQCASRFHQNLPYAYIGTGAVVAINTYKKISIEQAEVFKNLGNRALRRLNLLDESQTITFLGEPGSGKSEFKTIVTNHLLSQSRTPIGIRVRDAHTIFAAFTSTKTMSSNSASRAGQTTELQYSEDSTLVGAMMLDYRLERSRITKVPTGERNFHVFYYLLSGISDVERDHLQLTTPDQSRFHYLGHPSQLTISGLDDTQKFMELKQAFKSLTFSRSDIANICQLLAAILHIGQLQFVDVGVSPMSGDGTASIVNTKTLSAISHFLGVRPTLLENSLLYKTTMIGKDKVTTVLDAEGARKNADELSRCLYTLLFSWIVEKINTRINTGEVSKTISIVDFPGFSISSANSSLDKLLHNSAIEYLQNYMLNCYFERSSNVLDSENIPIPNTAYFDNSDIIKTLFRPSLGLLSIIDNYSKKNKSDTQLLNSLERRFQRNHVVEVTARTRKSFLVKHFAGEVEYSATSLLYNNSETISVDAINLFTSASTSTFLQGVFQASAVINKDDLAGSGAVLQATLSSKPTRQPSQYRKSSMKRTASRAASQHRSEAPGGDDATSVLSKSVSRTGGNRVDLSKGGKSRQPKYAKESTYAACGQFATAIETLVDSFESSNPYFVICLKPNDRRISNQFDARCVRQQVTAFEIPELTQRVKTIDFGLLLPFNEFIKLSELRLASDKAKENSENTDTETTNLMDIEMMSEKQQSERLLRKLSWIERDARVGMTGIVISERGWLELVDPENRIIYNRAETEGAVLAGANTAEYAEDDAFFYDPNGDSRTIMSTGNGNMFRFNEAKSTYTNSIMHVKDENEDDGQQAVEEMPVTRQRKIWVFIVRAMTWYIPDKAIEKIGKMPRYDIRVTWREKLAINLMIWLSCALCILFLVGFSGLVCPKEHVYSTGELSEYSYENNPDEIYTAIRGYVFDITQFSSSHYPSIISTTTIEKKSGESITDLFPIQLSAICNGTGGEGSISKYVNMGSTTNYSDDNAVYHDFRYSTGDYRPDWYTEMMIRFKSNYMKGHIGYTPKAVKKMATKKSLNACIIHGMVYDLSDYINGEMSIQAPDGETAPDDIDTNFMDGSLTNLFINYAGKDISSKFDDLKMDDDLRVDMKACLNNVFLVGKVDSRSSARCLFARYFLLALTCVVVLIIGAKFFASLQFGKSVIPENLDHFIIMQVPVYTEDETAIRRAVDSLARTKYDDKRKLLFIICDGMIVGSGNDRPTPRIVLDILGVPDDVDAEPYSFESLGEGRKRHNMGKVYSGLYETQGHIVPYIVAVKVGKPDEINKPGNRGKRDSQMLLMRFLNAVHYNLPMSPMELELHHQIQDVIGVDPSLYEFLFQVDADTTVEPMSAAILASQLVADTKIIANCGETGLSNAKDSMTTMIQVYEYFISHNMAKAFESLFNSVTCLPGCFSMFRIFTPEDGKPLFVSHPVVKGYQINRVDTLHMKNLLHLGEDRYLTTLLIKHHPKCRTKFNRQAHAYTIAPDNWSVLLSQRRRWINSTVHNLVELAPMQQLCGFCCFSMRFIVMVDLISTIIQPVTVAYLIYLFYTVATATSSNDIPTVSLIMLGVIYGVQVVVFLLRRKWDMIFWMIIYILAIPIYSLALPLYSFWYMDDFSWGNTRVVLGDGGNKKIIVSDEGEFDPNEIPLQTWEDYRGDTWQHGDQKERILSPGPQSEMASNYPYTDAGSMYSKPLDSQSNYTRSNPFETGSSYGGGLERRGSAFPDRRSAAGSSQMLLGDQRSMSSQALLSRQANEPTDQQIAAELRNILSNADLMSVTKRSLREALEEAFGMSLIHKKDYIDYATEAILKGEL